MTNYYFYVELTAAAKLFTEIDELSSSEYNCSGIEEFSMDEPEVDELLGERSYSGGDVPESVIDEVDFKKTAHSSTKKYYFNTEDDAKKFCNFLSDKHSLKGELIKEEVKDWNEQWRQSYHKINVDDKFEIIPEWEMSHDDDIDNSIYIYPGQGFGTGGHETTFLCLSLYLELFKDIKEIKNCLDFGCGSGILGLSVLKKFKDIDVDLYDIDPEALKNTTQNIEINKINDKNLKLLLPKDRDQIEKKYDLVFANILQNVLLLEKDYLTTCLSNSGVLILSGLLKGQETEVIKNYKSLKHLKTVNKGDWVAVALINE